MSVNQIKKFSTETGISVEEIYASQYQKDGSLTARLSQEVVTTSVYPSKKYTDELSDNLFSASDFGAEGKEFVNTEKRIAFMNVPIGTTVEQVVAGLTRYPKARIYKILSCEPTITEGQQYKINQGELTVEQIANSQQVVNPETGETPLYNGFPQYRTTHLSLTGQPDIDKRAETVPSSSFNLEAAAALSSFDAE
jgi:hypothetical protein